MFQEYQRVKVFQVLSKDGIHARGPETHGSKFHRAVGSMGASSDPSRTWKNQTDARTDGKQEMNNDKSYSCKGLW